MKWLYHVCLAALLCACQAPQPGSQVEQALNLALGVGDAVLRAKGAAELKRSVPELVPIIDKNHDDMLTLEEVKTFLSSAAADPQSVGLLIGALLLLRK